VGDALSRPSLRPGLHRSPAARYRYLHAPPLTACFPRGQLQQQVQRHAQRGTCTHRTLPPTRPSFSSSLFCAPAALFPSPSPKQTQSQSLQNIYFSPPGAKKEKNPTELLGLQVLLDLPPPSLGLCENLKLNPDTCADTWPSRACAARLARGSTACNCNSCSPSGLFAAT
jgi:hypothetical protein